MRHLPEPRDVPMMPIIADAMRMTATRLGHLDLARSAKRAEIWEREAKTRLAHETPADRAARNALEAEA